MCGKRAVCELLLSVTSVPSLVATATFQITVNQSCTEFWFGLDQLDRKIFLKKIWEK